MIFMFFTTIAALIYTSYNLLNKVLSGAVKGEALIGNTLMGLVGFFLVIAAILLGVEGFKAFNRYRALKGQRGACKGIMETGNRKKAQGYRQEQFMGPFVCFLQAGRADPNYLCYIKLCFDVRMSRYICFITDTGHAWAPNACLLYGRAHRPEA